jgi:hypothetical protein
VLGKTVVGFTAIDPHWQIPFIQQASASIERQVGSTMVIEVGYTGAWGRNLDRSHLVNNAAPSPLPLGPRRPYQTISFVPGTELPDTWPIQSMTFPVGPINLLEFTARSNYNAGYVQAKRRLVARVEFPGQLHVRQEPVRLTIVPIAWHGARGCAGPVQPRK